VSISAFTAVPFNQGEQLRDEGKVQAGKSMALNAKVINAMGMIPEGVRSGAGKPWNR